LVVLGYGLFDSPKIPFKKFLDMGRGLYLYH
jgi:hypothetical protein